MTLRAARHGVPAELNEAQVYTVIKHTVTLGASTPFEKEYNATGDHLYVAQIDLGNAVWVKVGNRRNPWIEVMQGDTITRPFTRFWVRCKIEGEEEGSFGSCLFYVSSGRLLDRAPKTYGLRRAPGIINATLSAVSASTLSGLLATQYPARQGLQSVGRFGGPLYVANMDVTNRIFMGSILNGIQSAGYPIMPQTSVRFDLDSSMRNGDQETDGSASFPVDLFFKAEAGTPEVRIMINLDFDWTRLDSDALNASGSFGPHGFALEDP
jgi:hypothetical protein